jgi:hypothetical protein
LASGILLILTMGDKPSKSHSDDEIFPPHLARTDFHFSGSDRVSFSDASSLSDADNRFHSRTLIEPVAGVHDSDSAIPVNGSAASVSVQSTGLDMSTNATSGSADSKKLVNPKQRSNSKPTSPDHFVASSASCFVHQSSESLSGSMVVSTDGQSSSDMSIQGVSDDVSVNSVEPPSPSTSSTKTVISVIHVQDSAGMLLLV